MKKLVALCLGLFFVLGVIHSSNTDFTIVIDPGHGGRDPGAVRGSIKEKNINLGVAAELGRLIQNNMPDVNVVYTRQTDVFVPLEKRSEIANKAKANLFISVHTNSTAATTTRASGADTYILGLARSAENLAVAKRENSVIKYEDDYTTKYEGFDPDSPESYIIFEFMTNQYMQQSLDVASYIQKDFKNVAKRIDRGVRQAGFLVLRESSMPSILIELGFINNPTEAKYLASSQGQKAMASAIYSGFKKYKADYNKREGAAPIKRDMPTPSPVAKSSSSPNTVASSNSSQSAGKDENTEYRVQFLYAVRKLPENSSHFRGVVPTAYTVDNGYKYTIGATTSYNEIEKVYEEVRKKFKDAFIVSVPVNSGTKMGIVNKTNSTSTAVPSNSTSSSNVPANTVEYRVQFLFSPTKLSDNSPRFQGLKDVLYYQDGGYKYTVGSTTNYNEILRLQSEVRKKFKDAFIIRMKNGKRL